MARVPASQRPRSALIAALTVFFALVAPAGITQAEPHPELTVMTRNLYLGSSLAPATDIDPSDPNAAAQFVGAVATIYGTSVFTDFPTRSVAIAAEVAADEPDLIGLQEVSNWTVSKAGNQAATAPSFDFLSILLTALGNAGLDYSVAGVSDNALIGPVPLVAPGFGCTTVTPVPDCLVTFADRDVILVNERTAGLTLGPARSDSFATQQVLATPAGPLSFARGWVAVDGRYEGKTFRMVNTHLETEDYAPVQEAQAAELLAGPARGRQTILTGDFNSAADGSQTSSYAQLTAPQAFTDAWTVNGSDPGLSCCQNSTLTNTTSQLRTRIDLVLSRGPIRPVSAHLVGATPFRSQVPAPGRPIWASDHAGVVATLRLR